MKNNDENRLLNFGDCKLGIPQFLENVKNDASSPEESKKNKWSIDRRRVSEGLMVGKKEENEVEYGGHRPTDSGKRGINGINSGLELEEQNPGVDWNHFRGSFVYEGSKKCPGTVDGDVNKNDFQRGTVRWRGGTKVRKLPVGVLWKNVKTDGGVNQKDRRELYKPPETGKESSNSESEIKRKSGTKMNSVGTMKMNDYNTQDDDKAVLFRKMDNCDNESVLPLTSDSNRGPERSIISAISLEFKNNITTKEGNDDRASFEIPRKSQKIEIIKNNIKAKEYNTHQRYSVDNIGENDNAKSRDKEYNLQRKIKEQNSVKKEHCILPEFQEVKEKEIIRRVDKEMSVTTKYEQRRNSCGKDMDGDSFDQRKRRQCNVSQTQGPDPEKEKRQWDSPPSKRWHLHDQEYTFNNNNNDNYKDDMRRSERNKDKYTDHVAPKKERLPDLGSYPGTKKRKSESKDRESCKMKRRKANEEVSTERTVRSRVVVLRKSENEHRYDVQRDNKRENIVNHHHTRHYEKDKDFYEQGRRSDVYRNEENENNKRKNKSERTKSIRNEEMRRLEGRNNELRHHKRDTDRFVSDVVEKNEFRRRMKREDHEVADCRNNRGSFSRREHLTEEVKSRHQDLSSKCEYNKKSNSSTKKITEEKSERLSCKKVMKNDKIDQFENRRKRYSTGSSKRSRHHRKKKRRLSSLENRSLDHGDDARHHRNKLHPILRLVEDRYASNYYNRLSSSSSTSSRKSSFVSSTSISSPSSSSSSTSISDDLSLLSPRSPDDSPKNPPPIQETNPVAANEYLKQLKDTIDKINVAYKSVVSQIPDQVKASDIALVDIPLPVESSEKPPLGIINTPDPGSRIDDTTNNKVLKSTSINMDKLSSPMSRSSSCSKILLKSSPSCPLNVPGYSKVTKSGSRSRPVPPKISTLHMDYSSIDTTSFGCGSIEFFVSKIRCHCTMPNPDQWSEEGVRACGHGQKCVIRQLHIECNALRCPTEVLCTNCQFQGVDGGQSYTDHMEFYFDISKTLSWRLRTLSDVKKGLLLFEVTGKATSWSQGKGGAHDSEDDRNHLLINSASCIALNADPHSLVYYVRIGGSDEEANVHIERWLVNGVLRLGVYVSRDLPPKSELVLSYQKDPLHVLHPISSSTMLIALHSLIHDQVSRDSLLSFLHELSSSSNDSWNLFLDHGGLSIIFCSCIRYFSQNLFDETLFDSLIDLLMRVPYGEESLDTLYLGLEREDLLDQLEVIVRSSGPHNQLLLSTVGRLREKMMMISREGLHHHSVTSSLWSSDRRPGLPVKADSSSSSSTNLYTLNCRLPTYWCSRECVCAGESRVFFFHRITRHIQWDMPVYPWESNEDNHADIYNYNHASELEVSHDEIYHMYLNLNKQYEIKQRRIVNKDLAPKPPSKETKDSQRKDTFRKKITDFIIDLLKPYREEDCKEGRITSDEDLRYLANKLSQTILLKELKILNNVCEYLEVTTVVENKTRTYVRMYLGSRGGTYQRPPQTSAHNHQKTTTNQATLFQDPRHTTTMTT